DLEFRLHTVRKNLHMSAESLRILKELHMAQLINLIIPNCLRIHYFFDLCDIFITCRYQGYASSREGNLRSREEIIWTILCSRFLIGIQNVLYFHILKYRMNPICVVPEHLKVFCRSLHRSQAVYCFVTVAD